MYNRLTTEHDFSQAEGYVLISIKKGGIPVTKIAPLMGIEPTSLSRLLKTMEDKGLVYREKDDVDRRVVRLFLTKKGLELKKISRDMVVDYNKSIYDEIGNEEMEQFLETMTKIRNLTCSRDLPDDDSYQRNC
jgi:DNA-binding MarR family transcriptional regulator